jgi:hypothetical protein
MVPAKLKFHVHCGRCRASIRVANINTVIANPHRKYRCRNCGAYTRAWSFGSALDVLPPDFEPFLPPEDMESFLTDVNGILELPTVTVGDVRSLLDKYLPKLSTKLDSEIKNLLLKMSKERLANDMATVLFEMHLILEAERKKARHQPSDNT